jgi:hypothetical protein
MITIRTTAYLDERGRLQEKDTKTHQQRRVVLDPETASVLREHRARAESRAGALGSQLDGSSFVFSGDPESLVPLSPEGVTQRYKRMAASLGIDTTPKEPAPLQRDRVDQRGRGHTYRCRKARPRGRRRDHSPGLYGLDLGVRPTSSTHGERSDADSTEIQPGKSRTRAA